MAWTDWIPRIKTREQREAQRAARLTERIDDILKLYNANPEETRELIDLMWQCEPFRRAAKQALNRELIYEDLPDAMESAIAALVASPHGTEYGYPWNNLPMIHHHMHSFVPNHATRIAEELVQRLANPVFVDTARGSETHYDQIEQDTDRIRQQIMGYYVQNAGKRERLKNAVWDSNLPVLIMQRFNLHVENEETAWAVTGHVIDHYVRSNIDELAGQQPLNFRFVDAQLCNHRRINDHAYDIIGLIESETARAMDENVRTAIHALPAASTLSPEEENARFEQTVELLKGTRSSEWMTAGRSYYELLVLDESLYLKKDNRGEQAQNAAPEAFVSRAICRYVSNPVHEGENAETIYKGVSKILEQIIDAEFSREATRGHGRR